AIVTIQRLIVIVPPNAAAVITGRRRAITDGSSVGYRSVIGGRTLRVPIVESVDYLPLETVKLEVNVRNAFSRGGIPLNVDAVANVKIASEPESVFNNAVERLLGKSEKELMALAQETLMGNLRGVLATLTPEEVNEDRLTFAQRLTEEAADDLSQLGFRLDVLKIQNVSDEVGYLDAIGRAQTAEILKQAQVAEAEREAETRQRQAEARRQAEIAEAEATAAVREEQAEARRRAEVAQAKAGVAIAEAENELRVRKAELHQHGETAERVATVEAQRAEVEAQRLLEQRRVEMTRERLKAEVVEPAQADEQAAAAHARAEAAPILERGKANAEVLQLLSEQLKNGGDTAFAALVMEKMPELFETAVGAVKGIQIDRLTVADSSGDGMGQAASARVNAALAVLENVASSFGIDLADVLRRAARQGPAEIEAGPSLPSGESRPTEG
ncbi:MAG: SPFH domain-containing protein, partial [Gemmatimonadota bacterium]|nr:SPFH domain-containing protein [Gemmatimonadota bacterium]